MNPDECILVIEALDLVRECVCTSLTQITNMKTVGVSEKSGLEMTPIATLLPRVVLISMSILRAGAIAFIRQVKRTYPGVVVLALISDKPDLLIPALLRAGADGYMLKDVAADDFGAAIRNALSGSSFTNADRSACVLVSDIALARKFRAAAKLDGLTPREREVLILVASAFSNKGIARHLGLSLNTVEKYRSSLMRKLGAHNSAGLTANAIARGWISTNRVEEPADDKPGVVRPEKE